MFLVSVVACCCGDDCCEAKGGGSWAWGRATTCGWGCGWGCDCDCGCGCPGANSGLGGCCDCAQERSCGEAGLGWVDDGEGWRWPCWSFCCWRCWRSRPSGLSASSREGEGESLERSLTRPLVAYATLFAAAAASSSVGTGLVFGGMRVPLEDAILGGADRLRWTATPPPGDVAGKVVLGP